MAAREVIDAWEVLIDECAELHGRVRDTVADLPEQTVDLSGSTSQGKPPALMGGDKLAALGPFSMEAPHDDFPHPLRFAYTWSWHCAEANAAIPPRRAWEPSIAYLRAHLHLIGGDYVPEFHGDLMRVLGTLRRLCNIDRMSQAETVADREMRGRASEARLRALAAAGDLPEWLAPSGLSRYRSPLTLTRQEAEILFPQMRRPDDFEFSEYDPADIDDAWNRIRVRANYWRSKGEPIRKGRYLAKHVQEEARTLKSW